MEIFITKSELAGFSDYPIPSNTLHLSYAAIHTHSVRYFQSALFHHRDVNQFTLTIRLVHDVVYRLLDCDIISTNPMHHTRTHTAVDSVGLLIWNLNAEFLYNRQSCLQYSLLLPALTSSIAMTTSTVSRLSRPRSLWKCDSPFSYKL